MNDYRNYGYQKECSAERCMPCKGCKMKMPLPETVSEAMAYVPFQQWDTLYPCEKALYVGTVFTVLDKPFLAGCCR